jgi:lipopolysaccharide/colanic/teichoic acid biosynthesis glycosyltransferase
MRDDGWKSGDWLVMVGFGPISGRSAISRCGPKEAKGVLKNDQPAAREAIMPAVVARIEAVSRTVLPPRGIPNERVPASPILAPEPEPHPLYNVTKRCLDIVLGVVLLILVSPVLILGLALVAISYRTNPFYIQRRVGYLGREFPMIKIKSMRDGADAAVPHHLNETDGPTFKATNDPRVTRIGRTLRLLSIDEVPQLINVVAGHMTLVGPRPPLPCEVASYRRPHLRRLRVKPGITCIWQVSGRSDIKFDTWMAMDRLYLRKRSLLFDFYLMLLTPWAVLTMRGAK